jgi:hypothetical protein
MDIMFNKNIIDYWQNLAKNEFMGTMAKKIRIKKKIKKNNF